MPSKKSRRNQDVKRSRAAVRQLRDKGIIVKYVNQKQAQKVIEKYKDVLTGRATVVPIPKGKSRAYKGYRPYKGKMVIPRDKGERIAVDKKTGIPYKTKRGVKTWLVGASREMPPQRKGTKRMYTVRFKNFKGFKRKTKGVKKGRLTGDGISMDRLSGGSGAGGSLANFMDQYEDTYGDWIDYLEIEDIPGDFDTEGYDEQEE